MAGVGAGLPVVITELFINNFNFGSYTYSDKNKKLFQSIDITQLSKSTIKYTINLQYTPDTFSKGEANYFESMLHTLITDTEEVTTADKEHTLKHNYIYVRFGYIKNSPYTGGSQLSPYYAGLITNATSKVGENCIDYTIEAYGCDCMWDNSDKSFLFKSINYFAPLNDVIRNILNDAKILNSYYFESDTLPSIAELAGYSPNTKGFDSKKVKKELNSVFDRVLSNYKESGKVSVNSSYTTGYNSSYGAGLAYKNVNPNISIPANTISANIMTMNDGLQMLVDFVNACIIRNSSTKKVGIKGKIQLCILPYVTSTATNKKGTIYLCDLLNTTLLDNYVYEYSYKPLKNGLFNNRTNGKVIDWNCTYSATAKLYSKKISLSKDTTTSDIESSMSSKELMNSLVEDDVTTTDIFGAIGNAFRTGTTTVTGDRSANKSTLRLTKDLTKIQTVFDYPYEAQITVLGNPVAVDLCRHHIRVNVLVNGDKHHTSGKYIIVGVSHNISDGYFTTTYKLVKYTNSISKYGPDEIANLPNSVEERAALGS